MGDRNPRWQQISRLCHEALDLGARERAAFLRDACAGDEELRREVESLLAERAGGDEFLGEPAIAIAARMVSHPAGAPMIGRRIGVYQLTSFLGSGGMGEVYRARDTKLGRDVAIKMLPAAFAADTARVERFQREARLLASLNHPHIGAIHGLEDSSGVPVLVLELVEGVTLAELLAEKGQGTKASGQKGLPPDEALRIARQIAEALEAAHERGIIHRDLKPANIKITPDGSVKMLDFGLAKATMADDAARDLSPSVAGAGTRDGVILGTAAYMSPEQARGQPVDKRTDIWAFGCVLFEMLAGRSAFGRDNFTDTVAAIVTGSPDWDALPQTTPEGVRSLLRRCLEKDSKQRVRDIGDTRIELEHVLPGTTSLDRAQLNTKELATWPRLSLALAATLALPVLIGVLYFRDYFRAAPDNPTTRLFLSSAGQITPQLSVTISPEGRRVAFVSTDASGRSLLWIRPLEALDAQALAGTEDAAHPFWSPDGRSIGFLAQGKLKVVGADGGPVQTLAETAVRLGASWGRSGLVLFIPRIGELAAVPATGGSISPVITVDESNSNGSPSWPYFLPDGRHFLYHARGGSSGRRGIYVGSLDSKATKYVLASDFKAAYAPPGYVFFVRDETLMAQPFDSQRLELEGDPVAIATGLWVASPAAQASFSVSATAIAHVNASLWNRQLTWFDRTGKPLGLMGRPDRYGWTPQLAPDGSRLAVGVGVFGSEKIWVFDAASGAGRRVTFGAGRTAMPVWAGDGKRLAFVSTSGDRVGSTVVVKDAAGSGSEEIVFETPGSLDLQAWSPNQQFLVYGMPAAKSGFDLWLLPVNGDRRPIPFLRTGFNHTQSQVSPNGRWIAYTSNESGGDEVYVESFPRPGSRYQVSTHGGVQPRWGAEGRELFYLASDQYLMSAPVTGVSTFAVGQPTALFRTRLVVQGSQAQSLPTLYDVTRDGRRFALTVAPDEPEPPMTVVLNWSTALKK